MARSTSMIVNQSHARQGRLGRIRSPATLAANVTEDVYRIIWGGRTFHLRKPIDLTVRREAGYSLVGYEPLGIEGYGDDKQQALESFADQFSATWDWIATARDSQLDADARQLKRKMLNLVALVKPSA